MAFRSPDPHNIRSSARKVGVIEGDRECHGCGYNLRGLRLGLPCPECGMAVADSLGASIDDPLALAPQRVILALVRGCWAASILLVLAVGLLLAQRWPDWNPSWTRWAMVPLTLLWTGSVLWLTPAFAIPQAASRGFNRRSTLRRLARWLQLGWVIAAAFIFLRYEIRMSVMFGNLCLIAANAGFLLGLVGLVLLAIMMERLAEWARDDTAQNLFNWAMWTMPITTLLMGVDVPLPVVRILLGILWLAGVGLFPFALISLSSSVTLSVVHHYEHRQRAERRMQRQRRYDEQVERTVRTMDAERARRGHV